MVGARPTRTPWAVVLFVLLFSVAASVAVAGTCRQINDSEFPVVGGLGGVWLSSSQVALTDVQEARFLVYDVDGGTVRSVVPEANGYGPLRILDVVRVRDGFWMATMHEDENRYEEGSFVLRLDLNLQPVLAYSWPREWGDDAHFHDRGSGLPATVDEIEVTPDGFVAWLYFARGAKRDGAMRFSLSAERQTARVVPAGSWRQMAKEVHPRVPFFASRLAATVGQDGGAYALRVGDGGPFIQRLVGSGERLKVFPDWPGPMPNLPPPVSPMDYAPWWKAVEGASFPAGLYAQGPRLYVLVRLAAADGPEWELHAIDPVAESLLHRVRLPTRAAHVSLVPGPEHWALIEGSSYFEDEYRKPKRLLMLDAEAIRGGEALSCN